MTYLLERIAEVERDLIVEEGFSTLDRALPLSGLAGAQFHACLAKQSPKRIDVHAFLAWHGQDSADLEARAGALRQALASATAFFSGRVVVTLFLVAETGAEAAEAALALRGIRAGHFLEKIQVGVADVALRLGQVRLSPGGLAPEPGLDWFEEHFLSGGRHEAQEATAALDKREEDERRSRSFLAAKGARPWATYALITLNACMFAAVFLLALQYAQQGGSGTAQAAGMSEENWQLASLNLGMNDGSLVFGQHQFWRLLASMFLHAGLIHLLMNMVSLYSLGSLVERFAGPWRMLLIYFCAGLIGSTVSAWASPAPSVGASGAILGLAGALLALHWRRPSGFPQLLAERIFGSLWKPVAFIFALGIGLRLFDAPILFDNWCHLGGLCAGFCLVFLRPGLLEPGFESRA